MQNPPSTNELKKAVHHLEQGEDLQHSIAHLSQAFALFSSETARLEGAYKDLKKKFLAVNAKLEERTQTLNQKVQELNAVSSYLQSILDNISQGIIFIKLDGLITTFNPKAAKLLGIKEEKALFHHYKEVFSDTLFGFSLSELLSSQELPNTTYPKIFSKHPSQEKELEVQASFLTGEESPPGIIILLRDITEFKQLQALAQRNDRLQELGEMAAAVAHEIRNPLGGIEGFASLLTRDLQEQPALKKMAENIVLGSRTLNQLVSQVLEYARPLHMEFQSIDLCQLVREACSLIAADPNYKKKLSFHFDESAPSLIAPADPNVLRRAILNLLINAAQAMEEGGKIALSFWEEGEHAFISIKDEGEGIPEENLEKVFSPFFTTKLTGNGFGLAEVHKVIQAHSGEISVSSQEHQGACFMIKLPLSKERD